MSRRDRNGFNSPFRDLEKIAEIGKTVKVGATGAAKPDGLLRKPARPAPAAAPRPPESADDADLFRSAVAGAVPIPIEKRNRAAVAAPLAAPTPRGPSENAEALAALSDLVAGNGAFDVTDTEEHVAGMVVGLDPRVLQRLRAGEFASQGHLDLHGLTSEEAKTAVRQFLLRALRAGHRCVLLVHGRGRNSPDQRPVLKEGLKHWLTHGDLARVVLAFSTARQCDGGAGAMYVLLRRERRRKAPFQTF